MTTNATDAEVLRVSGLTVTFGNGPHAAAAVTDASFSVARGEVFGLVGETGSGKSTVLRAAIGLLHPRARVVSGSVTVAGEEVIGRREADLQRLRRNHVAMVFQDPLRSLNPVLTIEEQVAEGLGGQRSLDSRETRRRVLEILQLVGIADAARRLRAYPHELSGGMQQRVAIAAAVIRSPELLLADEPTTALDVTIQDQILSLLLDLCATRGMSMVLVTHDIGVVANTCDRVGVMYAGRLAEVGEVRSVLEAPSHPYTAALLGSIPRIGGKRRRLRAIVGSPPDLTARIPGCPFAPRCPFALQECRTWIPSLERHGAMQESACLRHLEVARDLVEVAS